MKRINTKSKEFSSFQKLKNCLENLKSTIFGLLKVSQKEINEEIIGIKKVFLSTYLVKTCSLDCQCKPWKDCKWAAETVNLWQSTSNESYKEKLMRNTCNIPINGVCCCGKEQKSPEDYIGRGKCVKYLSHG